MLEYLPERGIIPAYAGCTAYYRCTLLRLQDHPRIRGVHFPNVTLAIFDEGSSPHTRGALNADYDKTAHARDHPRIRGVHMPATNHTERFQGSSPHTRGALFVHGDTLQRTRIIPAYAGCTSSPFRLSTVRTDHPRIRGVHCTTQKPAISGVGSSPHTRGALTNMLIRCFVGGIIPAYAGCTALRKSRPSRAWDHPRIRGVH